MSSRIKREAERNIRSNDFLQEGKADFSANAFATGQITLLDTKITESEGAQEDKISSHGAARQNYARAAQANHELIDAMDELVDFVVPLGDEIEGIEEKFRKTRSGGKRARITRARAFAAEAEPIKDILIGRGLDEDFIENLRAKADALENALSGAVSETEKRIGATDTALIAHRAANKIVSTLDPIVRKVYKNNPAKLAAWKFASRVQRDAESKPKPPPTSPA